MPIRNVLKMGNPVLSLQAEKIANFKSDFLQELIVDMIDTMRHLNGAGLAAPQIGVSKRVVIFGFEENARYPEASTVPFTVLINPVITPIGTEQEEGIEGCLSVPGLSGSVPRYKHIRYSGCDVEGNSIDREVSDFHARVVQHECDHLDGILYPARIKDFSTFTYTD